MSRLKLLIVDDNSDLVQSISDALSADFDVMMAYSGTEGVALAKKQIPDLVLVDMNMPNGDGIYFCTHVRAIKEIADIPLLIISAQNDVSSKLKMYDVGADDFIEKPFSLVEIKAKINARLRGKAKSLKSCTFSNVTLMREQRELLYQGKTQKLSKIEENLLRILMLSPDKLVGREDLYAAVWPGQKVTARTVDVHMANLRKKLPPHITIESRYGMGYQIKEKSVG